MKKILLSLSLVCLSFQASLLAQDMSSLFLTVPDKILIGVDAENKDKLVANQGDTVVVNSIFEGEIKRVAMTNDFISLETSDSGTLQMKLLPLINNSNIVCVVNTVCGKACDSYIRFFSTEWVELSADNLFPEIDVNWFIKANESDQEYRNNILALDMHPTRFELHANDLTLSVIPEFKKYLSVDEEKVLDAYLTDVPKVFTWDRSSFK